MATSNPITYHLSTRVLFVGIAVLALVAIAGAASAHQSPTGCGTNAISMSISRAPSTAQPGENVDYIVILRNGGVEGACDVDGASVVFTAPGLTGTASGSQTVLVSGASFPADGSGDRCFKSSAVAAGCTAYPSSTFHNAALQWPISVNPGVGSATASVSLGGDVGSSDVTCPSTAATLHDSAGNSAACDTKSVSVTIDRPAMTVTKTADGVCTEESTPTLSKSVDPSAWSLFNGESGTSEYTVDVAWSDPESTGCSASGTITVTNNGQYAEAVVSSVSDLVDSTIVGDVVCPGTAPYTIPAASTLECTYTVSGLDGTELENCATATADTTSQFDGDSGCTTIVWGEPQDTTAAIGVTDTNGDTWTFSPGSPAETYTMTFVCGSEEGQFAGTGNEHENTVTIDGTEDSASATVTIDCYGLTAAKTAAGTYDTLYTWDIQKSADPETFQLRRLETQVVSYTITVPAPTTSMVNSMVAGDVSITNDHPTRSAVITGVVDSLGSVDCGAVTFPHVLAVGETLTCTYSVSSDAEENTVTWTQQLYDFDETGAPTEGSTADYADTVSVSYEESGVIDECVDVYDDWNGQGWAALGGACATDAFPVVFEYEMTFGTTGTTADVIIDCGDTDTLVENTSVIVVLGGSPGVETDVLASATTTVDPEAVCEGPTRTRGFWSTHSTYSATIWGQIDSGDKIWCNGDFDLNGASATESRNLMMGAFWQSNSKTSDGKARTALNHARMTALPQIVAAMQNVQAFGTDDGGRIADAIEAFCGTDRALILSTAGVVDAWNNHGDAYSPVGFAPGSADSKQAKGWGTTNAVKTFYNGMLGISNVF